MIATSWTWLSLRPAPVIPAEAGIVAQVGQGGGPGVAHAGPQAPDKLVDDPRDRATVGDAALDTLRDQFHPVRDVLLEIPVRGAAGHGPHAAHPAVRLVGPPLVEERLARGLVGPGQQAPGHDAFGPGGERLHEIAARPRAAVGDHRDARFPAGGGGLEDGGELGDPHPGDDPRGADAAGADADLDGVRPGRDQRQRPPGGGHVPGRDLHGGERRLDAGHRFEHARRMPVGGVDDQGVDTGSHQGRCPLEPVVPHPRGGRPRAGAPWRPCSPTGGTKPCPCP